MEHTKVFSASDDKTVRQWDIPTEKELKSFNGATVILIYIKLISYICYILLHDYGFKWLLRVLHIWAKYCTKENGLVTALLVLSSGSSWKRSMHNILYSWTYIKSTTKMLYFSSQMFCRIIYDVVATTQRIVKCSWQVCIFFLLVLNMFLYLKYPLNLLCLMLETFFGDIEKSLKENYLIFVLIQSLLAKIVYISQ